MAEYSGQDRFPASVETINDGTVRDAASVNAMVEAALDRTTYLRNVGFRQAASWYYDVETGLRVWEFTSTSYNPNNSHPLDWTVLVHNTRAGDIIAIDACGLISSDPVGWFKIGATDNSFGGSTEVLTPGAVRVDPGHHGYVSMSTLHVVAAAGTTRIRMLGRYEGSLGGGCGFSRVGMLRAVLLRPS